MNVDSTFPFLQSFSCVKQLGPSDIILHSKDQSNLACSYGLDSYSKLTTWTCHEMCCVQNSALVKVFSNIFHQNAIFLKFRF